MTEVTPIQVEFRNWRGSEVASYGGTNSLTSMTISKTIVKTYHWSNPGSSPPTPVLIGVDENGSPTAQATLPPQVRLVSYTFAVHYDGSEFVSGEKIENTMVLDDTASTPTSATVETTTDEATYASWQGNSPSHYETDTSATWTVVDGENEESGEGVWVYSEPWTLVTTLALEHGHPASNATASYVKETERVAFGTATAIAGPSGAERSASGAFAREKMRRWSLCFSGVGVMVQSASRPQPQARAGRNLTRWSVFSRAPVTATKGGSVRG